MTDAVTCNISLPTLRMHTLFALCRVALFFGFRPPIETVVGYLLRHIKVELVENGRY